MLEPHNKIIDALYHQASTYASEYAILGLRQKTFIGR